MKQIYDHRVQGHVRQELEPGTKGPFVDEDANELAQHRFRIRGAGFEPVPDLAQCRQPALCGLFAVTLVQIFHTCTAWQQ